MRKVSKAIKEKRKAKKVVKESRTEGIFGQVNLFRDHENDKD
jgi:hypothetical protein